MSHRNEGFVLWFTGLSGAGKTTVVEAVAPILKERSLLVEKLDGDIVRQSLTSDLGFTKEDRDENIKRVTFVAKLLSRNGITVLSSFISPYAATRDYVRSEVTNFIEVYVSAPLDVCAERDVKGLYEQAYNGDINNFTGVSDPYEAPAAPEIVLPTHEQNLQESVATVVTYLEAHGYLSAAEQSVVI